MHVQHLPSWRGYPLKLTPRLCRFAVGNDSWLRGWDAMKH